MTYKRIVNDPNIAGGAPSIRGASVAVHEILTHLAAQVPPHILDRFPGLELADIQAALDYAAQHVNGQVAVAGVTTGPAVSSPEISELDLNRILVVDDLQDNLTLLKFMFRSTPFTVSMASNAQEAMLKAREERPGLIISDIQMPGLSGFELLQKLKADEQTKDIAVILVTAHQRGSRQTSQGLLMGADDYIYRPFMQDEFLSRVEAVLRVKRAEAEIRRQAQVVVQRNKGLELVNELALAVNSSLELQEIFASAIQKLGQLLDAEAVSLLLLNEEQRELVVHVSSRTGKYISVPIKIESNSKSPDQVTKEQGALFVLNILNERYEELGLSIDPCDASIESVPMLSKEHMLGAIAIINKQGGAFDEPDWALLNSAAGIIAVAMENARLLENARQQVDELIALNEIGRALTSTLDLKQILKQTTLLVQRALQSEGASLWLLDDNRLELILIASSGLGAETVTGFRLSIEQGIAGLVARTGEHYIASDVAQDRNYFEQVAQMSSYTPHSILCLPVQVKSQTIGVMQVLHRNTGWFDADDLRLAYPVANFVGIAVENARLFSEVQGFNRQLEQMVNERTRELAEEKEKTEAILASMADGLLVLDADNHILAANTVAESMLGFQLSDRLGQPIFPEQINRSPLWRCIDDMAHSPNLTLTASVDIPAPEIGTLLSIQAHSAKIHNETGAIAGTVIVLRDISTLKEVERMKARFMAGVTHELKTPLSIIHLHSKNLMLYQERLPVEKRKELLTSIQAQVNLLEQLIEDILQLSRLDTGVTEAERSPLDLIEIIDQTITDLRPLAEAKHIQLVWQKPDQPVVTLANSGQMERVVRNLIDNAIKYTPGGGSVQVQARLKQLNGRTVADIRIVDTGNGIPVEHQTRVFDRFYRVDASHTVPGTGLGLAIVKEIINAYGGNVTLKSIPGQGSMFTITLPAVTPANTN